MLSHDIKHHPPTHCRIVYLNAEGQPVSAGYWQPADWSAALGIYGTRGLTADRLPDGAYSFVVEHARHPRHDVDDEAKSRAEIGAIWDRPVTPDVRIAWSMARLDALGFTAPSPA